MSIMWWWNQCEEKFPSNATEMHKTVYGFKVFNITVFILLWVEHTSLSELLTPAHFFLVFNFLQKLCQSILFLLWLNICDNVDNHERFLTQFSSNWTDIWKLNSKTFISFFSIFVNDWNKNLFLSFSLFEFKSTLSKFEINTSSGSMFSLIEFHSSIINQDDTITSILSVNNNNSIFFWGKGLDRFSFFKANLSWLVIINNCHSSSSILSLKFSTCIWVI